MLATCRRYRPGQCRRADLRSRGAQSPLFLGRRPLDTGDGSFASGPPSPPSSRRTGERGRSSILVTVTRALPAGDFLPGAFVRVAGGVFEAVPGAGVALFPMSPRFGLHALPILRIAARGP